MKIRLDLSPPQAAALLHLVDASIAAYRATRDTLERGGPGWVDAAAAAERGVAASCELRAIIEAGIQASTNGDSPVVALVGDLLAGYTAVGPYPDYETARAYHSGEGLYLMRLTAPGADE